MSDIVTLLSRAAPAVDAAPSADVIEADLVRGRRALARRRLRRRAGGSVAVVAAAVAIAVPLSSGSSTPTAHAPHRATQQAQQAPGATHARGAADAVQLVAYAGRQPAGFVVDQVPQGWELQHATAYALLIAPHGVRDTGPDVFVGKLTVLLQSMDATMPTTGEHVTVAGNPGIIVSEADYGKILTYVDGKGHTVVIQVPLALHWTNDQIIAFAGGVHVTAAAQAGRG